MDYFYKLEERAEKLPWFAHPPTRSMNTVIQRRKHGRALDVGCGSGEHAIYLAKLGFDVTGIDGSRQALDICSKQAHANGVDVQWEQADVLNWASTHQFDIVFDRGCMHSLTTDNLQKYKNQVLRWLAPGGDFVLVHVDKWHPLDFISIGPERRSRAEITEIFSPQLVESSYGLEIPSRPLKHGPPLTTHGFVFRRPTL